MLDSYYRLEVPADLKAYYRVTNSIKDADAKREMSLCPDLLIERDETGCVSSVKYFTPEGDLTKEVCYKGSDICKINYYRAGALYSQEEYRGGLIAVKSVYRYNGNLVHTYEYEHDKKGRIISICKIIDDREFLIVYKYDDFGRIIKRKLYLNNEEILEQHYGYDILDRITAYTDKNQRIVVNKLSRKNELISYVITDRIGNDIRIENDFIGEGYRRTRITINGHCSTVNDISYVDNVMLKKPYTNEDDLDLIIANLFGCANNMQTSRTVDRENKATDLINESIELRVLPISMRKRLLYNKAASIVS